MSLEVAPYQDEHWDTFDKNNELIVRAVLLGVSVIEDGSITVRREDYEKAIATLDLGMHINIVVDQNTLIYKLVPYNPDLLPNVMYQESNETEPVTNDPE